MDIKVNLKSDLSIFSWKKTEIDPYVLEHGGFAIGCPYLIVSENNQHFLFCPSELVDISGKFNSTPYQYLRDGQLVVNHEIAEIFRSCLSRLEPDKPLEWFIRGFFEYITFSQNQDYTVLILTDSNTTAHPFTFWVFEDNQYRGKYFELRNFMLEGNDYSFIADPADNTPDEDVYYFRSRRTSIIKPIDHSKGFNPIAWIHGFVRSTESTFIYKHNGILKCNTLFDNNVISTPFDDIFFKINNGKYELFMRNTLFAEFDFVHHRKGKINSSNFVCIAGDYIYQYEFVI